MKVCNILSNHLQCTIHEEINEVYQHWGYFKIIQSYFSILHFIFKIAIKSIKSETIRISFPHLRTPYKRLLEDKCWRWYCYYRSERDNIIYTCNTNVSGVWPVYSIPAPALTNDSLSELNDRPPHPYPWQYPLFLRPSTLIFLCYSFSINKRFNNFQHQNVDAVKNIQWHNHTKYPRRFRSATSHRKMLNSGYS